MVKIGAERSDQIRGLEVNH